MSIASQAVARNLVSRLPQPFSRPIQLDTRTQRELLDVYSLIGRQRLQAHLDSLAGPQDQAECNRAVFMAQIGR